MKRLYYTLALIGSLAAVLGGTAWALGGTRIASHGDPFGSCLGVGSDSFGGINFPKTEVEPWVAANPTNAQNLVGSFQQDRWSDGGAKGLVAAWSTDGGNTWGETPLPFSLLAAAPTYKGGVLPYDRTSDPWDSIGPDGKAYAVSISFNANDNTNAVGAATSSDGGKTWRNLRSVITDFDSDPTFPFNDKESVTADPIHAGYAYVMWIAWRTWLAARTSRGPDRKSPASAVGGRSRAPISSTASTARPCSAGRPTEGSPGVRHPRSFPLR